MTRAQIVVRDEPGRAVITYCMPGSPFALAAWLWSLVGGLALGTGVALALVLADVVAAGPGGGSPTFVQTAAIGTAAGTLLLYGAIYWRGRRNCVLRVTFDYAGSTVIVTYLALKRRPVRYALVDALAFRFVEQSPAWPVGCGLVMDTTSAGPIVLATFHRASDTDHADLNALAERLTAYLDAGRDASNSASLRPALFDSSEIFAPGDPSNDTPPPPAGPYVPD